MSAAVLEASGLVCEYGGATALREASLSLQAGEFVGLLGPNGSGKSTFIKALSGVLAPAAGSVLLSGKELARYSPRERARLVACVPQRGEAPDGMTVEDIVMLGRYAHLGFWHGPGKGDRAAVRRALEDTDIISLAGRRAGAVSGGELQRAFLARALAQEAKVLLLDEPVSGLDPAHAVTACDVLAGRSRQNVAVLMASHDLNLAALYCSRLVFLEKGRIITQGPTHQVFCKEVLEKVYGTSVVITEHPVSGAPQALLLSGRDLVRPHSGLAGEGGGTGDCR